MKNVWLAVGLVLYLVIAVCLPVIVPLLGIYSDVPSTYPRLVIPLIGLPFLMGYAARLFGGPWRLLLWCPAVIMLALAIFSILDGLKKREYLAQDLIFWPILIACYLVFSYLGKRTRDRLVRA